MSIQWTLIAVILYIEIFVLLILVSPFFFCRAWSPILRISWIESIRENISIFFYSFMGIMSLFLIDSIRDMMKYAHSHSDLSQAHLPTDLKNNLKMFRAQRNYYITGFSMVLAFVIKRILAILVYHTNLQDSADTMIDKTHKVLKMTAEVATEDAEECLQEKINEMEENLQKSLRSLEEQKSKCIEIEKEVKMWRQKYEEVISFQNGQGDI